MNIIAMIPARYSASRFPGKLMKDLGGKPVILRTYEAALHTNLFDDVYVVTDSDVIFKTIETAGGKVIMSKEVHECGSDRIAEGVKNIETDIVINVQGDEPFIDKISLSKMTFSHQMIRLFIVEQLYRGFSILRNEPYHHE